MPRIYTLALVAAVTIPAATAGAQQMLWGDAVPKGWRGTWPKELITVAEQSNFTRTMSTLQLHEYISELKLKSDNIHVVNMFTTALRRSAPAIVLANPRVTTSQQARASGKPVIFLLGNIHPPEPEAAEAMLMVARDLAAGKFKHLLTNQIVMIAPIFNVDGTDTFVNQDGSLGSETPFILGVRENSQGMDLNRDGVKLQTVEVNGLYRTLNAWDPTVFLDGHLMDRVSHGYANTYGTTTVPAANPEVRDYTHDTLFPAVRDIVRSKFQLEMFTHAIFARGPWPPTAWSHDAAIWTPEAKFVVNAFGMRNRIAIITETPGQPSFERRIYAQYAYFMALLEYTNAHAKELLALTKKADDETVAQVLAKAESGELKNFLDGEYHSRGKIEVLGYRANTAEYKPGTSVIGTKAGSADGPPEVIKNVDDLTLPVGTRTATVGRGYFIPAELADFVTKIQTHNIRIRQLTMPMKAEVEEFRITAVRKVTRSGYPMTVLDGQYAAPVSREIPVGYWFIDMAQPMANAAFYYLEPQARDGFVGWSVLDDKLKVGAYPILKMRKEVKP